LDEDDGLVPWGSKWKEVGLSALSLSPEISDLLDKLPEFVAKHWRNFAFLHQQLLRFTGCVTIAWCDPVLFML